MTLYLFREGLPLGPQRLRRSDAYREVPLVAPSEDDVAWRFFVQQRPQRPVNWLPHVRPLFEDQDAVVPVAQSAGAVLLVSAQGRLWAITFGSGFHAVDQAEIEPDFGLRVAANSVDPVKINLAETRGLDKGARNAVSSLPVPNEMFALRVATNEEWVRRVGGKTARTSFAASVNGADSLRLNLNDFWLADVDMKLAEIVALYRSNEYKTLFPFLDYFRRLPNKSLLVPELDKLVLGDMQQHRTDVGFAAPDELAFQLPDYFRLRRGSKPEVVLNELTSDAVYGAIEQLDGWRDPMRQVKVTSMGSDGPLDERRPLRQYVVANVRRPDTDGAAPTEYALTAGAWFKVDSSYADRINRTVATVPDMTTSVPLPRWDDEWLAQNVEGTYAEQRYNRYASQAQNYALLDRQLYYDFDTPSGPRLEICDLLTKGKHLICVKRLDGSDKMVHLFEQGMYSASMMRSEGFRERVLDDYERAGGDRKYGQNSEWTYVFAIATSREGTIHELLPFFSKVSLVANLEAITDKGFGVAIAKIQRGCSQVRPRRPD